MRCRMNLARRLWLGAAALTLVVTIAFSVMLNGLDRLQLAASEAVAARSKTEALSAYQARENEWLYGWFSGAVDFGTLSTQIAHAPDAAGVLRALDRIDALNIQQGASHDSLAIAAELRAGFSALNASLIQAPPHTPVGQMALNYHSTRLRSLLARGFDQERRRHDEAIAQMDAARSPLFWTAGAVLCSLLLFFSVFYIAVFKPLFKRLREVNSTSASQKLSRGGHDELGLMIARQRRMAAALSRRQARLEEEISAQTSDLASANARLAAIDDNRRRFFADVGHELRTPLTVILGEAELGAAHKDPAVKAAFATVAARAEKLFRRIEDMLRIARSESGQLELQIEKTDLSACVAAALCDVAPLLRRADIAVQVDLPPLYLRSDGEWLRQVFAGFLENAVKYAGKGSLVQITVLDQQLAGLAGLSIRDNGVGLGQKITPDRLFDRFSKEKIGRGFGIGLALAHWVVESSGGSLRFANALQKSGFALEMHLPLWQEA